MVSVPLASVGIVSGTPHSWPAAIDTDGSVPAPTETRGIDERGPLFKGPATDVDVPDVDTAELPELSVLDPQADNTNSDEATAASRTRFG
jgi:hypothetical protein